MTNELLGILVAVIAVSVALGGLILTSNRGLRQDMAQMETRLREDMSQLRGDLKQLGDRVARLEHGQAKLEGLLEGLARGHHRTDCIRLGMEAMRRKRGKDEWFPLGDVFSGQGGPEQEIQEASPQAAYHFTRLDQVDQLVEASEDDPDTGFMARLMTLCSLPRTNPGNRLQYERVNGPYTLYMVAGGGNKLPYGNIPRLLLAWVCTEAVKNQKPRLGTGPVTFRVHAGAGDEGSTAAALAVTGRGSATR